MVSYSYGYREKSSLAAGAETSRKSANLDKSNMATADRGWNVYITKRARSVCVCLSGAINEFDPKEVESENKTNTIKRGMLENPHKKYTKLQKFRNSKVISDEIY